MCVLEQGEFDRLPFVPWETLSRLPTTDKKNITVNCIMLAQGEEGRGTKDSFGKQVAGRGEVPLGMLARCVS